MKRWLAGCTLSLATCLAVAFDYGLQPLALAPDVYVLIGRTEDFNTVNGGNIVNTGFIVGRDGVIVIDSGPSLRYGQQMRAAIARVTDKPVAMVINTHHHPDHFLGNQAFSDRPIGALPLTQRDIQLEGNAFAENLYRLSGDWMKGTEVVVPTLTLQSGRQTMAGRPLELLAMQGHTGADLVVIDLPSGVVFAGDLLFNGRTPTTPHADVTAWLAALDVLTQRLAQSNTSVIVSGHGGVARDDLPLTRTRAWLQWLTRHLRDAAQAGLDINEVLAQPLPAEFAEWPLSLSEYQRSVNHLFPAMEKAVLQGGQP